VEEHKQGWKDTTQLKIPSWLQKVAHQEGNISQYIYLNVQLLSA